MKQLKSFMIQCSIAMILLGMIFPPSVFSRPMTSVSSQQASSEESLWSKLTDGGSWFWGSDDQDEEDEDSEEATFPDQGWLTPQTNLNQPSAALENTVVTGQVDGNLKEISLGANAMLPLVAAGKLMTELLLVYRRAHVGYGENFFGQKAIEFNEEKTTPY